MDAKKTGALIAERCKAHGLTQKELAGRLMVSDKAVSKWETGAGYPEVTLLPLLAETLGITVDELLAGKVRAPQAAPEEESGLDAPKADGTPPAPSAARRQYAAEKLADADDKLLLGGIVLLLPILYLVYPFSYPAASSLFAALLCGVLFYACWAWHAKTRSRLSALGADGQISSRREKLLGTAGGGLLALTMVRMLYMLGVLLALDTVFAGRVLASTRRFEIIFSVIRSMDMEYDAQEVVLYRLYSQVLPLICFTLLLILLVLAYRRMDNGMRFRLLACGAPTLLAWGIAATMLGCRFRIIAKLEELDYGIPLSEIRMPLEEQTSQMSARFAVIWTTAVLLVLAVCILKRCGGGVLGSTVLCAVLQALLWHFPTASDYYMDIKTGTSYAKGIIELYPTCFMEVLAISLLAWAICTLLSGIRRKPKQPAAPASGAQPYS